MTTYFNFSGMNLSHVCKIPGPHAPHVMSEYKTVCHGWQDHFCTGRSGDGMTIIVDHAWGGDAAYPSTARGRWKNDS